MAKKKNNKPAGKAKKSEPSKPQAKREIHDRRITLKGGHSGGGHYLDKNTKILLYAFIILFVAFGVLFALRFIDFGKEPTIDDKLLDPALEQTDTQYTYNGFNFVKEGQMWYTQVQRQGTNKVYTLELHYSPKELEKIDLEGDPSAFLNITGVYILFDPTQEDLTYVALSAAELSLNLARALNIQPIAACTKNETEACAGRPIVDCTDTKYYTIWLKESEFGEVVVNNNCLQIKGQGADLVKATEKLLLTWYGIME